MNPYKMVITVANQKGGCSKTTTAVNVATALAKGDPKNGWPPAKVLLVDMDPQGNVSTSFGIPKNNLESRACRLLPACGSGCSYFSCAAASLALRAHALPLLRCSCGARSACSV